MTGVAIVGAAMRQYFPLHALIPADRIKAGGLPEGVLLPALLLRTISVVDRHWLKRGETIRSIARVSATVRAASYRDQCEAIRLVRAACSAEIEPIAGVLSMSILTAGTGPDVRGPGNSFEQAQDFRVSFDCPA